MVLTGTDAQTERPYRSRPRFARQIVTRLALILRMLVTCNDDVGTHSLRPLCQRLQRRGFNGDGRPPTRHYRAALQIVTRFIGSLELRAVAHDWAM
mgnify:FL=1